MRIGNYDNRHDGYYMGEPLEEVTSEKDIGVIIDNKLNFTENMADKINKANKIVRLIRRTFIALDEEILKALWVALARPHLEYANQVWAPYLVKDVDAIENVQRRATKLVPSLKNLSYEECLHRLGLPTLAYRRTRGEMIEVYKILGGVYDEGICRNIFELKEDQRTRGHDKKIYKRRTRLHRSKNYFCNRVVNSWNLLPPYVIEAETVKIFEARLDKAWKGQDFYYNYKARLNFRQVPATIETPPAMTVQENSEPDVQA